MKKLSVLIIMLSLLVGMSINARAGEIESTVPLSSFEKRVIISLVKIAKIDPAKTDVSITSRRESFSGYGIKTKTIIVKALIITDGNILEGRAVTFDTGNDPSFDVVEDSVKEALGLN